MNAIMGQWLVVDIIYILIYAVCTMNANRPMVAIGGRHCIYIDLCSVYNECYNGPMVGGRHCIYIDLCSVYNEC